ncbi:MAG: HAMP domain-containing histidine kinase [Tenericutes bacterium]|nr:HAMP domain-containing histidine kinase [Mycoplasmatota bacterium]
MSKISIKVLLIASFSMLVTGTIARLLMLLVFGSHFHETVTEELIFFGALITIFLATAVFTVTLNKVIVKRVKNLEKATICVKKGDFDIHLNTRGYDEISRLSENFNLMAQELKANEYLSKEFIRNFSHEFKTPLSVIRGYAEMVDERELSVAEKKEYLDIIISETQRLSNLTNNMLQISIIDSKSIIAKDDDYSITEQIRNVIQMTQLKWEVKKLSFDLDMDEIKIKNNKELSYQIILNLLSNAIKYSDKEEQIKISLKDSEDSFVLSITNKGQIIPTEDFDKVFQLFYISDKEKNQDSTGVGLTLTKKIVDKLKGNISFESIDDLTTFVVELKK